jgi:phage/plasmid primase-like uncharacterized protein
MADHLMEETLSPEAVAMGDYYTRTRVPNAPLAEGEGAEVQTPGTKPQPRRDMHPALSAALGLDARGTPTADEVTHLLAGRRADGAELATNAAAQSREISYIDLCFSAPKSVSLAWAFAPTIAERASILQAHRDSVDAALRYVATDIGQVRRGKGGVTTEQAHIGWIAFEHFTARPTAAVIRPSPAGGEAATELYTLRHNRDPAGAGDPQLHTHSAVPNVAVTDQGHVGALDLSPTRMRIHEYGAFYQAQLAANLRRLGIKVELDPDTATASLPAIPKRICEAFSKRTRDGTEAAREEAAKRGLVWDDMTPDMQVAFLKGGTKAVRRGKVDDFSDFSAWRHQAAALGWAHQGVITDQGPEQSAARGDRQGTSYHLALPMVEAEFARRAVVTGADLRAVAARALIAAGISGGAERGREDIDAVTRVMRERGILQAGKATALTWGYDPQREAIQVTTQLHESQESELVALAKAGAADRGGALGLEAIGQAADRSELDFSDAHGKDQRAALERLGIGGKVAVAIGVAGAGKTALMRPLVDAWTARGDRIYGVAVAWRQAEPLREAGISQVAALTGFLNQAKQGRVPLNARSVVVIDELGQVGARQMLELLRLRQQYGFRMVAIGDNRQCQSIEAGPVIDLLRRGLGEGAIPEILTTRRQRTERERAISALWREGKADDALAMKREDGSAEAVAGGYAEAARRTAGLWRARREANAASPDFTITVSAPTNADARAISSAIRLERRAMGELGEDALSLLATDQNGARYRMTLAIGDRVRLFDRVNARFVDGGRGNIGNNGSVLEVRHVTKDGILLRTARGRDGFVSWESLADKSSGRIRLAPGDVLTIDSAQGITSDEHINALPAGSAGVQGFKAYVAESRHREHAWLITSDGAERREIQTRRPIGDQRPISTDDVWDNVAKNLGRQPAKPSALAFLERVQGVRRGATRTFMASARATERRQLSERRGTSLVASRRRRRAAVVMAQQLARLQQAFGYRHREISLVAKAITGPDPRSVAAAAAQNRQAAQEIPLKTLARSSPTRRAAANSPDTEYWRRQREEGGRGPRPDLGRLVRRRREERAVLAVADRLALVLEERRAVLSLSQPAGGTRSEVPSMNAKPAVSSAIPDRSPAEKPRRQPPKAQPHHSVTNVLAAFASALRAAGLRLSGSPEMDGTMRRVPVAGDRPGKKSGSYLGHLDSWPAGYIRNHKTGEEVRWRAEGPLAQLSAAERAETVVEIAKKATAREADRQKIQQRAARFAACLLARAKPATKHPYLAMKGVASHGLRQGENGQLLVPMHDASGRIWGLQRIDADGSKQFLRGARTEGNHFLIGNKPAPGAPLVLAEGYATAATIHQATGLPVAAVMHASNLAPVAKAYRALDPTRPLLIAGDNDHHLPRRPVPLINVGKEKAEAAAAEVGGRAVIPSLEPNDRDTDWNDVVRRVGPMALQVAIARALDELRHAQGEKPAPRHQERQTAVTSLAARPMRPRR